MRIQIYLVATTSMGTDPLSSMNLFLAEHGLTWEQRDTVSDSERLVEAAGRICYMSFGDLQFRRSNLEYVSNLIQRGHDSVLEHANFTLLVAGISRALSHQIVRHRIGFAYSQLSQQYKDEKNAKFVEPEGLELHPELRERWHKHMQDAQALYSDLMDSLSTTPSRSTLSTKEGTRMARSIARSVLPNATSTVLMITGNARAWRHFLLVRGAIAGDQEMRSYCVGLYRVLSQAAPSLFADYEVCEGEEGLSVSLRS